MKPQLRPEFVAYFNDTVLPAAKPLIKHFPLIMKVENKEITPDSDEAQAILEIQDPVGIFYIGHMINDVQRAIFHGQSLNMPNSLSMVSGTLCDESYYQNVFGDKQNDEEATRLKEFGKLISQLIKKL